MFELESKMGLTISSVVKRQRMAIMFMNIFSEFPCLPEQTFVMPRGQKGTDLDGHSFCCFEVSSMYNFISGLYRS